MALAYFRAMKAILILDFFLISLDDRLQEGKKLFFLLGIAVRVVYVPADLPHEFDVVHECPSPTEDFTAGGSGRGIQESLHGEGIPALELARLPRLD
jgi:hypothetical protein